MERRRLIPNDRIDQYGMAVAERVDRDAAREIEYMRAQNLELTRSIAADYYYEPVHA